MWSGDLSHDVTHASAHVITKPSWGIACVCIDRGCTWFPQLAAHIEAWVVSQIVKHEDRKWGSLVSAKLFMDREYVVKHIHNKHQSVIQKEKEKVRSETAARGACDRDAAAER